MPPAARREKRKFKEYFMLKRVLFANLVLFGILAYGFSGEYFRNRALEVEIERLESQAQTIESRNSELAELGKRFANPEAIEREARVKLGLRKPGESVIILQGETPAADERTTDDDSRSNGAALKNPQKWWRYFFH